MPTAVIDKNHLLGLNYLLRTYLTHPIHVTEHQAPRPNTRALAPGFGTAALQTTLE